MFASILLPEATMLTLLESRRRGSRTIGSTTASVLLHAALLSCAVYLTAQAKELPVSNPPEAPIPLFPPTDPAPKTKRHRTHGGGRAADPGPVPSVPVPSIEIPNGRSPIDTHDVIPDAGVDSAMWGRPTDGSHGTHGAGDGTPFVASQVEKPAVARDGNPPPRYPSMLEQSRVEGAVLAQFVVDTTGRAEMSTFEILQSTNELFAAALRDVVPRWRFLPAEAGGRRVRQVVEVPVRFVAPRPR
jgi:periplasmic protein TonB